ncbi:MAG: hypothetical protein ACKO34_06055 [Vampirovibrionales bacterium]
MKTVSSAKQKQHASSVGFYVQQLAPLTSLPHHWVSTAHPAHTSSKLDAHTKLMAQTIEMTVLKLSLTLYEKPIETLKHSQQLQQMAVLQLQKVSKAVASDDKTMAQKHWKHWQAILSEVAEDSHTVYGNDTEKLERLGLLSITIPLEMTSKHVPTLELLTYFSEFWVQHAQQFESQIAYLETKRRRNQVILENHEASRLSRTLVLPQGLAPANLDPS